MEYSAIAVIKWFAGCGWKRKRAVNHMKIHGSFRSVKKVRLAFCVSCGSTHKIEFAKQIHKFREHVSRNLYKGRKNVPARRVFSSEFDRKRGFDREAARKTLVFRQPQAQRTLVLCAFFIPLRGTRASAASRC